MMMLLRPDGTKCLYLQREAPSLEQLYEITGCQTVELLWVFFEGKRAQLWVDELGKFKELPINHQASMLLRERHQNDVYVVGMALLCTEEHEA